MNKQNAFTFIEVVVAMGVVSILFSIASTDLFHIHYRTNLANTMATCIADVRGQQLKSMTGSTEGALSGDNYGVYFSANQYVLFKGTYVPSNPTNRVINLEYPIEFNSISFPSATILFASGSGSIVGYDPNQHTVGLLNTVNGEQKTINFNSLGVPI